MPKHDVVIVGGAIVGSARIMRCSAGRASRRKGNSAMVGMPLPIEPLRRFEHYFETPNRIEPLPYVKDTARLAFRPERKGYSGGLVNSAEPRGYNFYAGGGR
jgi:hypothetical protein